MSKKIPTGKKLASIDIGDKNLSIVVGIFSDTINTDDLQKSGGTQLGKLIKVLGGLTITNAQLINVGDNDDNNGIVCRCESVMKTGARTGQKCGRIAVSLVDGAHVCKMHGGTVNINDVQKKGKSLAYTNKQQFCYNLIKKLDSIGLNDVQFFIIERQPPKNRIMSEVSHYVFMYLVNLIGKDTKKKVLYFNAKKRMKSMCELFEDQCQKDGVIFAKNTTYTARKKNSIKLASFLVNRYIKLLDGVHKVDDFRKQDDISDCIIQLIFYVADKFLKSF